MKTLMLSIIFSVFGSIGCMKTFAQTEKETQEVIIRKNSDKDTKVTVEISGNKITINGKPLAEFKEDGITINNRKMIIKDGNNFSLHFDDYEKELGKLDELNGLKNFRFYSDPENNFTKYTFLGVSTIKNEDGLLVEEVVKASPAEKAGLLLKDIIYKIDETAINNTEDLSKYIRSKKSEDKVKVYFLRDGKKKEVTAVLAENNNLTRMVERFNYNYSPETNTRVFKMPKVRGFSNKGFEDNLIFDFAKDNHKLGIKIQDTEDSSGVKILDANKDYVGAISGLLKNDVIINIGDKKISNTDEAREAFNENIEKNSYPIKVKRDGKEILCTIKIPRKLKTANL